MERQPDWYDRELRRNNLLDCFIFSSLVFVWFSFSKREIVSYSIVFTTWVLISASTENSTWELNIVSATA